MRVCICERLEIEWVVFVADLRFRGVEFGMYYGLPMCVYRRFLIKHTIQCSPLVKNSEIYYYAS